MARMLERLLADHYRMVDNPKCEDYDPFKADFRNFLYYVFKEVLKFGEPHALQYDIADYMQNLPVSQDGTARGQAQAMRGCGKTVIACAFCAWLWYCNPAIRALVVSSVQTKAEEFAGLVKQIVDSAALLEHLRPNIQVDQLKHGKRRLKVDQNTLARFDIAGAGPGKDPSFAAYGVYGGYTGSHPDIIIPDDVEIPENSLTQLKRERLFNKMQEFESLILKGGAILQMGTPQTEESVYNKSEKVGYPVRKWPAELPDLTKDEDLGHYTPYIITLTKHKGSGSPTYPERFPIESLMEKRAKGEAYYRLQMLLDTSLADLDRYPLKTRNLIVLDQDFEHGPVSVIWGTASPLKEIENAGLTGDCFYGPGYQSPDYEPFQGGVMYIDPKGGGGDTVGYGVAKTLRGLIYVPAAGGLAVGAGEHGTAEAVLVKLAKIAAQWGVKRVQVESNWGGSKEESAYARLLQPIMAKYNGPTQIETVWNTGQKERRILDDLEPLVNMHKVIVSREVARRTELMYQLTHITRERGSLIHDDEIEALWGAVRNYKDNCVMDSETAAAMKSEQASREAAKEFEREYHKSAGGAAFHKEDEWKEIKRRAAKIDRKRRWTRV